MHVEVVDVSSAYAVLGLMGPNSRALLQRLSTADLSTEAFPFGTSQLIDVGFFTVRATRLTYVGELGWELYVPAEFANGVYDLLHEKGVDLGLRNAGYYAINALRLEKGYRAFGPELSPEYNPVEAGLLFACKLKSDIPFLGREALEAAKIAGPRRRLVSLVLEDPDPMMWGGELVLRDGVAVGQVTSAAWATTTGACVALAYVWQRDGDPVAIDYLDTGRYEINVGGSIRPATLHRRSPLDPTNSRVKQ
jgi:glycine cleavage system aminomethyltransferase T